MQEPSGCWSRLIGNRPRKTRQAALQIHPREPSWGRQHERVRVGATDCINQDASPRSGLGLSRSGQRLFERLQQLAAVAAHPRLVYGEHHDVVLGRRRHTDAGLGQPPCNHSGIGAQGEPSQVRAVRDASDCHPRMGWPVPRKGSRTPAPRSSAARRIPACSDARRPPLASQSRVAAEHPPRMKHPFQL